MTVFTIGHSTRSIEAFIGLLKESAIDLLLDIRRAPRSRRNPQFNSDALAAALAAAGIGYRHLQALGGLRHRSRDAPPSPNGLWENEAFRNYADYAAGEGFRAGLEELMGLAREHRVAIMCAEAVWWRCHRRIVADHLLAAGVPVVHILGPGKTEPARLTPGAVPAPGGGLTYPARPPEPDKALAVTRREC